MQPRSTDHSKIMTLAQAIRRFVRPGIKLHLCGGIGGPSAAICEIIRQFHGTTPGFELIQSTLTGHATHLVHCNLVQKIVFAACMEITATGHPSKVAQRAYESKGVAFENWSLLSLQQRLMAGAMGVGFLPTRSIVGSTLADDNRKSFTQIDNPFQPGEAVGLVEALCPDLSIVHGCGADPAGNIILQAPYGDDLWGPMASVGGVIATVEKIISPAEIQRFSALVKIPAYMVRAVCLAPQGLHPFALTQPALESITPYEIDLDFLIELHEASATPESLDRWIHQWVIDLESHDAYLQKLQKRSNAGAVQPAVHAKTATLPGKTATPALDAPCTLDEILKIAAAREIVDSVLRSGLRTMLVGAGSMALAARLAYYQLVNQGYAIELITGNGQIGYTPDLKGASIQTIDVIRTSKMLTDTIVTHGVLVGGRNSRCLSVLGAGQVDRFGNINSSRTSSGGFLIGTGGANDAANASEVILIVQQKKSRFVEKLPYLTARGHQVTKVISSMGIFRKAIGDQPLCLSACLPGIEDQCLDALIAQLGDNCGWPIGKEGNIQRYQPPTQDELTVLRDLSDG